MLVYETGKAAVVGLTRQLAVQYGPDGIRANAIGPGHIVGEGLAEMWNAKPHRSCVFRRSIPFETDRQTRRDRCRHRLPMLR